MSILANSPRCESQPVDACMNSVVPVMTRAVASHDQSILGKSLIVRGEISGNEPLHILGEVQGPIDLPGCYVQVGPNGSVSSNITARRS